jgi:hypothetical protein
MLFITGSISEATHMASTRSCRGLAGPSIAVRSTFPRYVCNSRKVRTCLTAIVVRLLFHSFLKRGTILNAEHSATLDMLPRGLDDVFNLGEVESADDAARLASRALRRSLLNADPCVILRSTPARTADSRRECLHASAER